MAKIAVAPLVGAWIEIACSISYLSRHLSLPSWERGLKFSYGNGSFNTIAVAPLVGAWIEIMKSALGGIMCTVAPLVGAWIEMQDNTRPLSSFKRRSPRGSVD